MAFFSQLDVGFWRDGIEIYRIYQPSLRSYFRLISLNIIAWSVSYEASASFAPPKTL